MLDQLIEFTSSEENLMRWNMWTIVVNIKPRVGELKMVLELFDDLQEIEKTKQVWEITGEGYWTSRDTEQYKRPFNRIRVYQDHPVLWAHGDEQYFSVSGTCDNISGLMGDL